MLSLRSLNISSTAGKILSRRLGVCVPTLGYKSINLPSHQRMHITCPENVRFMTTSVSDILKAVKQNLAVPTMHQKITQFNEPALLKKYNMVEYKDTVILGEFPDYRPQLKPNVMQSPLFPQPYAESSEGHAVDNSPEKGFSVDLKSKESYTERFQNALFNFYTHSEPANLVSMDADLSGNEYILDAKTFTNLTWEEVVNLRVREVPRFSKYTTMSRNTHQLLKDMRVRAVDREPVHAEFHRECELYYERYVFILELIRNPNVPNWYIMTHLHAIRTTNQRLGPFSFNALIEEAQLYQRYGLVFQVFSMYNHGLCTTTPDLQSYYSLCSTVVSYAALDPLDQSKEINDGIPKNYDDIEKVIGSVFYQLVLMKGEHIPTSLQSSVFNTFSAIKRTKEGSRIFQLLLDTKQRIEVAVYNGVMRMFNLVGDFESAKRVYGYLEKTDVQPDAFSSKQLWNILRAAQDSPNVFQFLKFSAGDKGVSTSLINYTLTDVLRGSSLDVNISSMRGMVNQMRKVEDEQTKRMLEYQNQQAPVLLTYDDVLRYQVTCIKLYRRADYIFRRIHTHPEMRDIPFCNDQQVLFTQFIPQGLRERLSIEEQYVLFYINEVHPTLISTLPGHVRATYAQAYAMNNPHGEGANSLETRIGRKVGNGREPDVTILDSLRENIERTGNKYDGTFIDRNTVHFNSECTIPIPVFQEHVSEQFLYTKWVGDDLTITNEDMQHLEHCIRSSTMQDIDYSMVPDNVKQAIDLYMSMHLLKCYPDANTYGILLWAFDIYGLSALSVRMYNRSRLSCVAETVMNGCYLAFALFNSNQAKTAIDVLRRADWRLFDSPSIIALALKCLQNSEYMTVYNIMLKVIEAHGRKEAVRAPGALVSIFQIVISAIKRSAGSHVNSSKKAYTEEQVFIINKLGSEMLRAGAFELHLQQVSQDNDTAARDVSRALIFCIQCARIGGQNHLIMPYKNIIKKFDPTFDLNAKPR